MTSEPTVPPLRHAPAPAAPPPPLFANTPAAHQSRCKHLLPARQSVAPPDHSLHSLLPKPSAHLAHSATSGNENPSPAAQISRVGKQYPSQRTSPSHLTAQYSCPANSRDLPSSLCPLCSLMYR